MSNRMSNICPELRTLEIHGSFVTKEKNLERSVKILAIRAELSV